MKNYLLPTLLWALATCSLLAQKTLSPGVKPYADNWSYNVKRLFHHAGFDLSASETNKVSSRSVLQLDSTKTYNEYNLNAPGDSTPVLRSDYTYPSSDTKIELSYQFIDGAWQVLSRFTSISDDQQRQVEVIAESFDFETQTFQFDSRLRIFPHGNSQQFLDSVQIFAWDSTAMDWHIVFGIYNTFDSQDRLVESVSSIDYFGDPLIFKEKYSYNNAGDNFLIEEFAILGIDTIPSARTEITYSDHRPIESNVFVFNGINFALETRETYAYTTFGALRLTLFFEWDVVINDLKLVEWVEHKFDNEQRIASTETTTVNPDGSDVRQLSTFAYIEDENPSLEISFNWDHDLVDWILDTKKHYYYDGFVAVQPEPGAVLTLQIVPNPTVDAVRLTLENEARVQVFDHAGRMVQSGMMQPGQMLNVVALPAGIYQVTAQQGDDFFVGKMLKQ